MQTKISQDDGQLYLSFMQELKTRLHAVHGMLTALPSGGGALGFLTAEACFLQVRFMCELLALASLSAHEPIGLTKKLKRAWHADEIFAALATINSRCFPAPIRLEGPTQAGLKFHVLPTTGLQRGDLRKIYNECGRSLHRGAILSALRGEPRRYDLDVLNGWCRSISQLLAEHVVYVPQLQRAFIVRLGREPGTSVELIVGEADYPA
jgi:hypothetical protein